jgi:hypothetical protein
MQRVLAQPAAGSTAASYRKVHLSQICVTNACHVLLLLLLHRYNAHVVLDAAGATAASYRKVHLFDVDVPKKACLVLLLLLLLLLCCTGTAPM